MEAPLIKWTGGRCLIEYLLQISTGVLKAQGVSWQYGRNGVVPKKGQVSHGSARGRFRSVPGGFTGAVRKDKYLGGGRARGSQGLVPTHMSLLQKRMGRKEKEKQKRLFANSPSAAEVGAKFARTSEVGIKTEVKGTPQEELLTDMYENMDIPTSPTSTEKEMASRDMMTESPFSLREEGSREAGLCTPPKKVPWFTPVREDAVGEKEKGMGSPPKLELELGDTEKMVTEDEPDWRIPTQFRLDWFSARVEFLMMEMDIIGGMFSPIFVEVESSPIRITVKNRDVKEESPQREVAASFFKLKSRRSKVSQAADGTGSKETCYSFEAEGINEGHLKVIESLNSSKENEAIAGCIAFLKMIKKVKERQSSYAGKASGRGSYDRLWEHGSRKLVSLAVSAWHIPTALPVLPLIKGLGGSTEDITIHGVLSCPMEDALIRAFPLCEDEEGKEMAVDYWACLVDTHDAVIGKEGERIIEVTLTWHWRGILVVTLIFKNAKRSNPEDYKKSWNNLDICHVLISLVSRVSDASRGRWSTGGLNKLLFPERMAEALIMELMRDGGAPKEVRLRHLSNVASSLEDMQARVKVLKVNVTKSQGDAALKRLALEGSKRLAKALDSYGVLLGEGSKYLEGKSAVPPSFKHIYKGLNSALLPAAMAVWGRKKEGEKAAVLTDLMTQEFWAAFFREAQGTPYHLYLRLEYFHFCGEHLLMNNSSGGIKIGMRGELSRLPVGYGPSFIISWFIEPQNTENLILDLFLTMNM